MQQWSALGRLGYVTTCIQGARTVKWCCAVLRGKDGSQFGSAVTAGHWNIVGLTLAQSLFFIWWRSLKHLLQNFETPKLNSKLNYKKQIMPPPEYTEECTCQNVP